MDRNDKIVIIGVTGYIGTWIAKQLTDMGYSRIIGTYRMKRKSNSFKFCCPI
ncbi:NAD-dependent epimerase/dehydratase family protein [Paenibacillus gorillae]|uniref:NAD-dependent epimerase/dehydratase family protein n=1 Tax=Paenibacillus gorillae TaxID=1243662 RepID=UPI0004B4ADA2